MENHLSLPHFDLYCVQFIFRLFENPTTTQGTVESHQGGWKWIWCSTRREALINTLSAVDINNIGSSIKTVVKFCYLLTTHSSTFPVQTWKRYRGAGFAKAYQIHSSSFTLSNILRKWICLFHSDTSQCNGFGMF